MSAQIIQAQMIEEGFSAKDLKDIFCLIEDIESDTYDLLVNRKNKKTDNNQQVIDALQGWTYTKELGRLSVCGVVSTL